MSEEIRLTRDIHNCVRGKLNWEESSWLLDEIIESDEWMSHLEIDMMIYQMAIEKTGIAESLTPVKKSLKKLVF